MLFLSVHPASAQAHAQALEPASYLFAFIASNSMIILLRTFILILSLVLLAFLFWQWKNTQKMSANISALQASLQREKQLHKEAKQGQQVLRKEFQIVKDDLDHCKSELKHKNEILYLDEFQVRAAELVNTEELLEYGLRDPEQMVDTRAVKKTRDTLDSILYARQIQQAMLPKLDTIQSHIPESFVLFRPRDMVSGDFYWFNSKSHRSVIGAVDCTGHGVPGAFLSMIGNELLNKIVIFKGITEPDKILNQLQLEMRNTLKQKENGNEDGMDIGLCSFHMVPLELQEMFGPPRLEFAGARNNLIYIQDQTLKIIKGDKVPIGGYLYQEDYRFTKHSIPLDKDTCVYLFSDGYADQFGGEHKKKYMVGRFRDLLLSIHHMPMAEQKKVLAQTLSEWMGKTPQIDDILVMGFKFYAESQA